MTQAEKPKWTAQWTPISTTKGHHHRFEHTMVELGEPSDTGSPLVISILGGILGAIIGVLLYVNR